MRIATTDGRIEPNGIGDATSESGETFRVFNPWGFAIGAGVIVQTISVNGLDAILRCSC